VEILIILGVLSLGFVLGACVMLWRSRRDVAIEDEDIYRAFPPPPPHRPEKPSLHRPQPAQTRDRKPSPSTPNPTDDTPVYVPAIPFYDDPPARHIHSSDWGSSHGHSSDSSHSSDCGGGYDSGSSDSGGGCDGGGGGGGGD